MPYQKEPVSLKNSIGVTPSTESAASSSSFVRTNGFLMRRGSEARVKRTLEIKTVRAVPGVRAAHPVSWSVCSCDRRSTYFAMSASLVKSSFMLRIAVIGLEALAGEAFAGVKCVGTLKQAAGLARRSISICRRIIEVGHRGFRTVGSQTAAVGNVQEGS